MKKGWIIALALVPLFLLSACSAEKSSASNVYYSFTDDAGISITLPEKPQKVAVLFSSFADVWTLSGGEVSITVGESVERGLVPDTVLLVDSGAGKVIDHEILLSSEPDFIICSADIEAQAETADMMNQAGIPCAQFHVECFEDYLRMLDICTDITGDKEAYQINGEQVKTRIDKLLETAGKQETEKRILFIRSGSGESSAKAKTADQHFAAEMLEELGVYNIADNAPVLLDGLSLEEILTEDPDLIFISTMGDEEAARAYMDSVLVSPAWQALHAVQTGNYFYLPKDLFQYKPNAHWDEAYSYLFEILYPEITVHE